MSVCLSSFDSVQFGIAVERRNWVKITRQRDCNSYRKGIRRWVAVSKLFKVASSDFRGTLPMCLLSLHTLGHRDTAQAEKSSRTVAQRRRRRHLVISTLSALLTPSFRWWFRHGLQEFTISVFVGLGEREKAKKKFIQMMQINRLLQLSVHNCLIIERGSAKLMSSEDGGE